MPPSTVSVVPVTYEASGEARNRTQAATSEDSVVQSATGTASAPALSLSFAGLGQGFSGPAGTFSVNSAPPDTNHPSPT